MKLVAMQTWAEIMLRVAMWSST